MSSSSSMSDPVFHILLALVDEPRHGYAIVQEVDERTDGTVRLGTGTLYTALKRLRQDGLIMEVDDGDEEDDGRQRRTYCLTEEGREAIREQAERLRALVGHAVQKQALEGVRV